MLKKLVIVGSLLAVAPLLAGCPGLMAYNAVEAMGLVYRVTKGDHVGNKAASESPSPNNASKSATETTSRNPHFFKIFISAFLHSRRSDAKLILTIFLNRGLFNSLFLAF